MSTGEGKTDTNSRLENINDRLALAGVIIGFVLLIAFSVIAGMSIWTAVLFFAIYFTLSVGITRMRAELGSPVHDLHRAGTHYMMVNTQGFV